MNVAQLYRRLSYGEFSNLSLGLEGTGGIEESRKPKIIIAANEALLRLHSRFVLIEKDVLIEMVDHVTNYHLLSKFAESQFDPEEEVIPYIKDLGREPFTDDVIKVTCVYDSHGCLVPLNDDGKAHSVFTPTPLVLQVPRPIHGAALSVLYQAKHPALTDDDEDQEIFLPETLHGALTAYIAYKVFSQTGTQEATAKAQEHQAMYESICTEVQGMDLVSSSKSTTSTRFEERGWA